MNSITYALCSKQIIGPAMWIVGLCSFPPPVPPTEVSLQERGLVLQRDFEAPVSKAYGLDLRFIFPSVDARLKDELVGDGRLSRYCDGSIPYSSIPQADRQGLGRPIPLKVVVRKQAGGALVVEQVFDSLCMAAHGTNDKSRALGPLVLKEGAYRLEVHNLIAQPTFKDVTVELSLVPGGAK